MRFGKAREEELCAVEAVYQSVIGTPFCTWNEFYPDESDIRRDFESGNLYVCSENGSVIGAVSVVPENELDAFSCFRVRSGNAREIARLAVLPGKQGQGIARRMVEALLAELKEASCPAVHLLVAEQNEPAQRLYRSLGFSFLEKTELYGNVYFVCEKCLAESDA